MIIGVDFDGTIADTNSEKATWIKRELGFDVKPYMCDRTSCVKVVGQSEYERMSAKVYSEEKTLELHPIMGALEALEELRRVHEIVVVTARTNGRLRAAADWLGRYDQTRDLRCLGAQPGVISKVEVCLREGATVLVDDDERHVLEARDMGVRGILFKNLAPPDYRREDVKVCWSWKEITVFLI